MEQDIYIKIADEISDKLILLSRKETKEKSIIEIYNKLLEKKYEKYRYEILSYIPKQLAIKGYEIVNSKYFELKKY